MTRFDRAPRSTVRLPSSWPWLTWLVFSLSLLAWSLAHAAGANAESAAAADVDPPGYLSDAKAIDGVDRGLNKRSIASLVAARGETGLFSTLRRTETRRVLMPGAGR